MQAREVSLTEVVERELSFEPCGLPDLRLRAALWGGLSSGKTYTALAIASGLGNDIYVIDTNRGQSRHYRDLAEFKLVEVPNGSPARLISCIEKAVDADVLVLDTASAEWVGPGSILDMVETLPVTDKKSPWSIASPLHNQFMDTLLNFPGHVIATYQAKHSFEAKGGFLQRNAVSPVWKDGTEYLFNFVGYLKREQSEVKLVVEKSLFDSIPYLVVTNPGKEFGAQLLDKLSH